MNNFINGLEINEEERVRTEQTLRKHWHDDSICMLELIREEYKEEGADVLKKDEVQGASVRPNEITSTSGQETIPNEAIALPTLINDGEKERETQPPIAGNYYVIVDYDLDLDWVLSNEPHTDIFEKVSSEITIIKTMPHSQLRHRQKLEMMRLLGNALVAAICNQEEEANKLLFESRKFILDCLSGSSRLWTLTTSTIVLAMTILIHAGSGYWLWDYNYPNWWLGCTWGIIGAYLSIARKVGKEHRDAEVGIQLHILNVAVKFLCASIMGGLSSLILCNGRILPPVLLEIGKEANGVQLIGFVCGFCENLIPNLIAALPKEK